ncbi:hypothetical protein D3C76_1523860 [compost metagenome]
MFVWVNFTVDCVTWATCTGTVRASALSYKARDNAVECKTIVETGVSQFLKVCYCVWSFLIEQIDQNFSAVCQFNFRLFRHM